MRAPTLPAALAIVLILWVAGCAGPSARDPAAEPRHPLDYPRGIHPYPNGTEWPADAPTTFEFGPIEHVRIPSFDGTELDTWIARPKAPAGLLLPIVLRSTPYMGLSGPPTVSSMGDQSRLLVSNGYAVVFASVRGTGTSGGCFENKGPNEQKDQAFLVEALAALPWSNGRVGMMGLSYPGTTPFMAAIQDPPHLKAIVPMGPVTDPYTELHTPQGAFYTGGGTGDAYRRSLVGLLAPYDQDPSYEIERVPVLPDRFCPEFARVVAAAEKGAYQDDRDAAFWRSRQLIHGFPNITAAVFVAHGLLERDHPYQEDVVWQALAPNTSRMLLGQWDHEYPPLDDWNQQVVDWFDFWLKGIGGPPSPGLVEFQDGANEWHNSTAWPPAGSHDEVLYLSSASLAAAPTTSTATFRSAPHPYGPEAILCPTAPAGGQLGLAYSGPVSDGSILLAGNPFVYLPMASDQPGGIVAAHLYETPDSVPCRDGRPSEIKLIAQGAADLRFHGGNLVGKDFPVGTGTVVRIDFGNLAEPVEAGHRIRLVLSRGYIVSPDDPSADFTSDARTGRSGSPSSPMISIVGEGKPSDPHLVLPVLGGSVGAPLPDLAYPPRPFAPRRA